MKELVKIQSELKAPKNQKNKLHFVVEFFFIDKLYKYFVRSKLKQNFCQI